MSEQVLVTGALGFIGSHLTRRLIEQNYSVRIFADYLSHSRGDANDRQNEFSGKVELCSGDIRDPHTIMNAVRGCTKVFHLASLVGVPYSYQSPNSYLEVNVKGTLNILQAAREVGCDRIVYVSTSEVYGPAKQIPVNEEHPLAPQSPYAATKCSADQLALSYHSSFGTPVVVLRPFNTYGPGQSARAVIPATIKQLTGKPDSIKLGALHPTRDFTYVEDMVDAFLLAATAEEACGQAINLGSNFETSIAEAVNTIIELMGSTAQIECDEARLRPNSGEDRVLCDNTKAKTLLNWKPGFAGKDGFRNGLRLTIDSFLKHDTLAAGTVSSYHV